mgnify:CR=1 FL=1
MWKTRQVVFEELFQKNKNTDMTKKWDDYRKPYASVIKNLLNNIDICSRRYIEEDEKGYLVQIDKYKKEIEELKAHIKKEENIDNG